MDFQMEDRQCRLCGKDFKVLKGNDHSFFCSDFHKQVSEKEWGKCKMNKRFWGYGKGSCNTYVANQESQQQK